MARAIRTDVLVVGAGPAGSAAAAEAAGRGVDVVMLERKEQIGSPVQCAEYVHAGLIGELGCNEPAICVQKISTMRTYIDFQFEKETPSPGFMINRDAFDQWLAQRAVESGADLLVSTRAHALAGESSVLASDGGNHSITIEARIIVAADGPLSSVRRWLKMPPPGLLPAAQMSFRLTRPSAATSIYLDRNIRGGYGWLFPKNGIAHVGLGMRPSAQPAPGLTAALNSFISRICETGAISGPPLYSTGGWIPVEPMQRSVSGRTLFAGDAAGQTHPITGAGIFPAVACGAMAGRWAAAAVRKSDPSVLLNYEREWRDLFGRTLAHAVSRRKTMESRWRDFDQIIRSCWIAFPHYHGRHV